MHIYIIIMHMIVFVYNVQVRVEFGGCVTAKRMVAFAAGGAILGMGMTVSGAVSMLYVHVP